MSDVFVEHLTFALGEEKFSVSDSEQAGRLVSNAEGLAAAGFEYHHLARPRTSAYDLARRAVEPIRGELGPIDAVVYSTCIPCNANVGDERSFYATGDVKHLMDFPASRLQAEYGLDRAIIVGLSQQACTGMLGSLRLSRALVACEPEVNAVLCVTADRFPAGARYEQAYNLISDGAAACVVSTRPSGFRLIACHSITNGALAQASDDEAVGSYFTYTLRVIGETLQKCAITLKDIRWIVTQNMNLKAWQILSRILKFDSERIYNASIADVGHVISADNLINLKRLCEENKVEPGDRLLLCMAGYGLTWQCAILEKV